MSYKPCATCGRSFSRHHHGNEKYCSQECRDNKMAVVHRDCVAVGCQARLHEDMIADLKRQVQEYKEAYSELKLAFNSRYGKESNMTDVHALWCTPGAHSFDPNDPERHRTTVEDAEGEEITVMSCGEHTPEILKRKSRKSLPPTVSD